uniref:SLC26A/SulP transporter domain-containing protein n=1 Tax=Oryzias latipes TaxID=8090 RepID=A0A3B3HSF1_ORYLA
SRVMCRQRVVQNPLMRRQHLDFITPKDCCHWCQTLKSGLGRPSGWSCCSWNSLKTWLPILSWLPRYKVSYLQMDVLAGLTVGLTVVPQALAYAEVAGLPVQYGLYSAFMGGFIYTVLGTSKDVTLGPTAIMSLLCFSVVGGLAAAADDRNLPGAVADARFLLDFISYPVIKGFTCAAAVTIGFGQVKVSLDDGSATIIPVIRKWLKWVWKMDR